MVGARYYHAQGGRFITRDTYLDQAPYLYCEHDPVNALDPSGHISLQGIWSGIREIAVDIGGFVKKAIGVATGLGTLAPLYVKIHQLIVDVDEHANMIKMLDNWDSAVPPGAPGHDDDKKLPIVDIIDHNYGKYLQDIGKAGGDAGRAIYGHSTIGAQ